MSQLHFPTCHRVWEISLSHSGVSEMPQKLDNDKGFPAVKECTEKTEQDAKING